MSPETGMPCGNVNSPMPSNEHRCATSEKTQAKASSINLSAGGARRSHDLCSTTNHPASPSSGVPPSNSQHPRNTGRSTPLFDSRSRFLSGQEDAQERDGRREEIMTRKKRTETQIQCHGRLFNHPVQGRAQQEFGDINNLGGGGFTPPLLG